MIEEKTVTVKTASGAEKSYILSKFPAVQGREIICKYPLSAMPKLGDYAVNEQTMFKLMAFVQVEPQPGVKIALASQALIDNHVPDPETLMKLEGLMLEYNVSFFGNAKNFGFLANIKAKAPALITKILTDYSEALSRKGAPPSTN